MKTREVLKNAVTATLTLAVAGLAAGVGCSMDNPAKKGGTFSIKIEDDPNAPRYYSLARDLDFQHLSSQIMSITAPASAADFNCFAVNVTGPGIISNNRIGNECTILDNMQGRGVGIISNTVPRGKTIELDVLPGSDRRVDVYGVFPPAQECGGGEDVASESRGYYLGGKTVEIRENTQVTVQAAYQSGQPHSVACVESRLRMRMSAFGYTNFGHRAFAGEVSSPQLPSTPIPGGTPLPSANDYEPLKMPDGLFIRSYANSTSYYAYQEAAFKVDALDLSKYSSLTVAFQGLAGVDISTSACDTNASSFGATPTTIASAYIADDAGNWVSLNTPNLHSYGFYRSQSLYNPSNFDISSSGSRYFVVGILGGSASSGYSCVKTDYVEIELAK